MSNRFLRATEYANTMLALLKNNLAMGKLVNGRFENQVSDENGLIINVKRPPRFVANSGAALTEQAIVTGSESVRVDQYKNVHIGVGDLEYIQDFNQLMRSETMKSAASELAHDVDRFLHGQLFKLFSSVNTAGEPIRSPQQFNSAHTRLMEQSAPNDGQISGIVTYQDGELIRGNLIGTDIGSINRSALERTRIPVLSEINLYASNNTRSLVTGSRGATGAIDGATQNVDYEDVRTNPNMSQTLDVDGLGANATVSEGEIFTIAGVLAVNPRSRESVARLQQFVVLADATANAGGEAELVISPAIIVAGTGANATIQSVNTAFQTVTAVPADDAVITWEGAAETAFPIRAAFHKSAITLVSAKLQTPFGGTAAFATDPETGISIRYWRDSDINTGRHLHRWDMVYGGHVMDNYLGTRVSGLAA